MILVNSSDHPVGSMEKMEAHEKGLLHRAFSVFVFNSNNELLLHQRAHHKYHSGGLWTNTCCSHPRVGESNSEAAHRRLQEEMGFDCPLTYAFNFTYHAKLDKNLIEHELDHVFIGRYNGAVAPNPEEVADYRYVSLDALKSEIAEHPQRFTAWFKIAINEVLEHFERLNHEIKVA